MKASSDSSEKSKAAIATMLESNSFDDFIVPLYPSGYKSLILPCPEDIPDLKLYLHTDHIRIAILDSPPEDSQDSADPPPTAAMIVPRNRETDWIFCTEAGQMQLLLGAPGIARFILIGPVVGEMLVEDVEIEDGPDREFRRRLRFRRMPNLTQSEIKIIPDESTSRSSDLDSLSLRDMKFQHDLSALVHVYLAPMVAGLSLASVHFQTCLDSKIRLRALCLGVGGGSLVGFLATQLDFVVVGIEIDEVVSNTARKYFGLEERESVRVIVGDGIEYLKAQKIKYDLEANSYKDKHDKVDVITVDLDPRDFSDTSVPPWKFQHERVISAAKCCLRGGGLLVLNVIPPTKVDFEILVLRLRAEFAELYKIDTGNGENFVVIAAMSATDLSNGGPKNEFIKKLKSLKCGEFLDKIVKI